MTALLEKPAPCNDGPTLPPDLCDCDPEPAPKSAPLPSFGPDNWDADEVKNFFDKRFEN